MVKKCLIVIAILLFPALSFAADFTARVDRNSIAISESLNLTLTLSDTSAKNSPDLSELQQSFTILRQGQSSSTTVINGKYSSSKSWNLMLSPKKEGDVTIPAISIKTDKGTLKSKPITISIGKASSLPQADNESNIVISSEVSKKHPYKNEPFVYSLKLVSKKNIVNVSMGELSLENAIIEQQGKPEISDGVINGIAVKVIEASYIITPLKSGSFTIPSIVIKGDVPTQRNSGRYDPFGMIGNFGGFGGIDIFGMQSLEPFAVASKEQNITVKPAPEAVTPWLPATSLKLSENTDNSQIFQAGEPFTRTITIVAEGVTSSQLPDLEPNQIIGNDFKVYPDQPTVGDDVKNGKILSWKAVNYTLIPQKSGELTLPEIAIKWWDVEKETANTATLAGRTLTVTPGTIPTHNQTAAPSAGQQPVDNNTTATPPAAQQTVIQPAPASKVDTLLYWVIVGLVTLLLLILLWALHLKRNTQNHFNTHTDGIAKQLSESYPPRNISFASKEAGLINTPEALRDFLQNYAHTKWGISKNASLEQIFTVALKRNPTLEGNAVNMVIKTLHDGLYADKDIDIADIKERCFSILKAADQNSVKTIKQTEKLPELNPS